MNASAKIIALQSDQVDLLFVTHCLADEAALVRVNAISSLSRLYCDSADAVIAMLESAALDPKNSVKLLGNTTVGDVAIEHLIRLGTTRAVGVAREIISGLEPQHQVDLRWYLKSEGLSD